MRIVSIVYPRQYVFNYSKPTTLYWENLSQINEIFKIAQKIQTCS